MSLIQRSMKPHTKYFKDSFDQRFILLQLWDYPDGAPFNAFRQANHFESTIKFLANVSQLVDDGRVVLRGDASLFEALLIPVRNDQNLLFALGSDFRGSEEECLAELKRMAAPGKSLWDWFD